MIVSPCFALGLTMARPPWASSCWTLYSEVMEMPAPRHCRPSRLGAKGLSQMIDAPKATGRAQTFPRAASVWNNVSSANPTPYAAAAGSQPPSVLGASTEI